MRFRIVFVISVLIFFVFTGFGLPPVFGSNADDYSDSYVVVTSKKTYDDPGFRKVVDTLLKKHNAELVVYADSLDQSLSLLIKILPRYVCFVEMPENLSRQFILDTNRLTRKLDDDPYGDVIWAVLTGYDADDALRIATCDEPLTIRKALSGTIAISLDYFDQGLQFHESKAKEMSEKLAGRSTLKKKCPQDTTKLIVDAMNNYSPDAFYTSGHATTKDWQIGFSYKNGSLRCADGQLYGLDLKNTRSYPINSPNSKVFLPMGNCLIGEIPEKNCMALALMKTGGVNQMFGYTAVTFYGYSGWGIRTYFMDQPARFTLAESNFCNNQALIHRLNTGSARLLKVMPSAKEYEHKNNGIGRMTKKYKLRSKDMLGLLWDRDVIAFYGDPAWSAKMPSKPLNWTQSLTKEKDVYKFTITTAADGKWTDRPVVELLDYRIKDAKILSGQEFSPVITDNFILIPLKGKYTAGQKIEVTFKAEKI